MFKPKHIKLKKMSKKQISKLVEDLYETVADLHKLREKWFNKYFILKYKGK